MIVALPLSTGKKMEVNRLREEMNNPYMFFCFVVMDSIWFVNLIGVSAILALFSTDFDVGMQFAQAVIVVPFMSGTVIGQLVLGSLSDRFGRVPVFVVTLNLYAVSTLLCFFTPHWAWLAFFRTTSGIAGSVGMITVRSVINDAFTLQEGTRVLSHISSYSRLLAGVSPFAFYILVETFGWRAFFVVNAIFCSMVSALSFILLSRIHHVPDPQALSMETIGKNLTHTLFHYRYQMALLFFMLISVLWELMLFTMPVFLDDFFDKKDWIYSISGVSSSLLGYTALQVNRWLLRKSALDDVQLLVMCVLSLLSVLWAIACALVTELSVLLALFLLTYLLAYGIMVTLFTNAFAVATQSLRRSTKGGGFVTSLTISLSTLCHAITGALLALIPLEDMIVVSVGFMVVVWILTFAYWAFFQPIIRVRALHSAKLT